MALSFPLSAASFSDLLRLESVVWTLRKFEEMAGAGSGEWLTAKLMPDLWEAECQTVILENAEAHGLRALLDALGSSDTFYLNNRAQLYPDADPNGTSYGASTPTISGINASRLQLAISGLPANYVLTRGDLFQVDYDTATRRALIEVVESVTANGSGVTAQFEVRPALRPAIATSDAVSFASPAAKMKVVPGSVRMVQIDTFYSQITFTARQTLEAN